MSHENISPDRNIFEDDAKLIEISKRLIETRERLKERAMTNPEELPTPQRLAIELGLTLDEVLELIDFADNYLGEFEMRYIAERATKFVDINTGRPVDPFNQSNDPLIP